MTLPVDSATRKRVLKVVFVSLLLDLISFTFILPLFPQLLEFYRSLEAPATSSSYGSRTILSTIIASLNAYKSSFARPIDSRYDIVILGGALGSLFSFLQAIASPVIGKLSDKYGRRQALLMSMCGNIASVLLWVCATDFRTFLMSRIVGGLSEGNVQIATAIAADVSSEEQRGSTMAIVGACFCIAFTFGPALGAYLSTISTVVSNPFATAAGFSLFLIVVETLYLYLYLPETLPSAIAAPVINGKAKVSIDGTGKTNGAVKGSIKEEKVQTSAPLQRTNSHIMLNFTHFAFIIFFSGMEFSLPFMTHDLFDLSPSKNGRLLGYMGLIASLLQGGVTRRLPPLTSIRLGVVSCLAAFFLLSNITTIGGLYAAATLLAVTTATVVTGLNALSSFEAGANERGSKLGNLRSWGQIGRATGPLCFCTLYWWAGREIAYQVGGAGMALVAGLVFAGLRTPKGLEKVKIKHVRTESVEPDL